MIRRPRQETIDAFVAELRGSKIRQIIEAEFAAKTEDKVRSLTPSQHALIH